MKEFVETIKNFSQSRTGKIAIIALLAILLVVVALVIKSFMVPSVTQTPKIIVESTETSRQATVSTEGVTANQSVNSKSEASIESGFEVFSTEILKDPFEDLEQPVETTQTTQTVETEKQTLILAGVSYGDGVFKADVIYNRQAGTVAIGETVGPYLLVEVGSDTAKFLYGDAPITLKIGETYNP